MLAGDILGAFLEKKNTLKSEISDLIVQGDLPFQLIESDDGSEASDTSDLGSEEYDKVSMDNATVKTAGERSQSELRKARTSKSIKEVLAHNEDIIE